jgi:tetratricopeptide (TPR) repeat protein
MNEAWVLSVAEANVLATLEVKGHSVTDQDPVMTQIGEGIELSHTGNRDAARQLFSELWEQIGGDRGDPLHRCALAHSMAEVQNDVGDELTWDHRALEAADLIRDDRAAAAGVSSSVAGFYPSLHLNLGECYRKLGEYDHACRHLEDGLASVDALPDDGYGHMIKGGLERLRQRLQESDRSIL